MKATHTANPKASTAPAFAGSSQESTTEAQVASSQDNLAIRSAEQQGQELAHEDAQDMSVQVLGRGLTWSFQGE